MILIAKRRREPDRVGEQGNAVKAGNVQYTACNFCNRKNHMATMLEVAKRAGVSKATVSRVLSGNGYVSQETKDRVFKAVAESGYRPNLLARNGDQNHANPRPGGDQYPVPRRLF